MTFVLPKPRTEPLKVNPKKLLLIAVGKMGKTTLLSKLPNCLVLDLEGGSDFAGSGTFIDVKKEAEAISKDEGKTITPLDMLGRIGQSVVAAGNPYDYIAIDPITSLEEMVMPLAVQLYKATPMGKSYKGTDVTTLPNGAGYKYAREAFKKVYMGIAELAPHILLIGHIKDKTVNKRGEEVSIRDLDLTGKLSRIVAQDMDAIGIIYAKGNERWISFAKEDTKLDFDSILGNRIPHLAGKDFLISQMDDDGNVEAYWDKIFI